MHRFFVDKKQINAENKSILITGEDHHHLTRVLRIKPDEVFEVCDGAGTDYHCVIHEDRKDAVTCKILESYPAGGEGSVRYTLFQGLPKGTKMDEVVQKNVELGIAAIVPFIGERTVVDLKGKESKKVERWQKIAYAAAKQSKRGIIPMVENPIDVSLLAKRLGDYDLAILCYEEERSRTLKQALESYGHYPHKVCFIIGPEGGLASREAEAFVEAGAISVSLGSRILRTETAGMSVLSQLSFYFGEGPND